MNSFKSINIVNDLVATAVNNGISHNQTNLQHVAARIECGDIDSVKALVSEQRDSQRNLIRILALNFNLFISAKPTQAEVNQVVRDIFRVNKATQKWEQSREGQAVAAQKAREHQDRLRQLVAA